MQRTLPISINPELSLNNFIIENNKNLIENLSLRIDNIDSALYIYGNDSSGKTHILQAFTNIFIDKNKKAIYYDLKNNNLSIFINTMLDADIVLLDNFHYAALTEHRLIFDLYNHSKNNFNLIIASKAMVDALKIMPDLQTRLKQSLNIAISSLSDEAQIKALALRANNKNIQISNAIFMYLQKNYSRDLKKLMQAIDILDKQSLLSKKKISKSMVKKILL